MLAGDEVGVGEDGEVGRDGGGDALDLGLLQGAEHASPGVFAVLAPHDQLGHQVVVELADGVALFVAGVGAGGVAVGPPEPGDGAGRRKEPPLGRVLGVDAALDGVAAALDVVLTEWQRLARCDAQLVLDKIDSDDELGDRVLYLQAGVHLQEEEVAVLKQELDGACVDVTARLRHVDGRLSHRLARLVGEERRRALFDQLLVPALRRAVALAEPHHVAVGVGEDLHLDVTGPREITLDVALGPPESLQGLVLSRLQSRRRFAGRRDHAHPPPASAVGGLDGDGPAELLAEGDHLVG